MTPIIDLSQVVRIHMTRIVAVAPNLRFCVSAVAFIISESAAVQQAALSKLHPVLLGAGGLLWLLLMFTRRMGACVAPTRKDMDG